MAWSMPLRMPRNLCIWGAMAGWPPTCAQRGCHLKHACVVFVQVICS